MTKFAVNLTLNITKTFEMVICVSAKSLAYAFQNLWACILHVLCFLIYLPLVNGSHLTKRGQWNNLVKLMISNNLLVN